MFFCNINCYSGLYENVRGFDFLATRFRDFLDFGIPTAFEFWIRYFYSHFVALYSYFSWQNVFQQQLRKKLSSIVGFFFPSRCKTSLGGHQAIYSKKDGASKFAASKTNERLTCWLRARFARDETINSLRSRLSARMNKQINVSLHVDIFGEFWRKLSPNILVSIFSSKN